MFAKASLASSLTTMSAISAVRSLRLERANSMAAAI
jgi:hypothetical protein